MANVATELAHKVGLAEVLEAGGAKGFDIALAAINLAYHIGSVSKPRTLKDFSVNAEANGRLT